MPLCPLKSKGLDMLNSKKIRESTFSIIYSVLVSRAYRQHQVSPTLSWQLHISLTYQDVVILHVLLLRLKWFLSRAALLVLIMLLCLDWEKEAEQAKQFASLANEEEALEEQEEAGGDQFSDALSLPPSPTLRHISIGECFPVIICTQTMAESSKSTGFCTSRSCRF